MWRYPGSASFANAARASTSDAIVSGSAVIHSDTFAVDASEPALAMRIMSRSVRMPIARWSALTTTTEPTFRSRMHAAASATVSAGRTVTTGWLMMSPTVRSRAVVSAMSAVYVRCGVIDLPRCDATRAPTTRDERVVPRDRVSRAEGRLRGAVATCARREPGRAGKGFARGQRPYAVSVLASDRLVEIEAPLLVPGGAAVAPARSRQRRELRGGSHGASSGTPGSRPP